VMAWAIDRIGRSLIDLLNTIETLKAVGVDLYLDQQAIDTTTPTGKLMLQMTGAFAEFERNMIQARIHAGLKRAVAAGKTLGRPLNDPDAIEKAKRALRKGIGVNRSWAYPTAQCSALLRSSEALSSPGEASPLSGRAWDLPAASVKAGARAIDPCHHQAPATPSASRPRCTCGRQA
jgi:hypothetical protein